MVLGWEEVRMLCKELKEGKLKSEYIAWKYIQFQFFKKFEVVNTPAWIRKGMHLLLRSGS